MPGKTGPGDEFSNRDRKTYGFEIGRAQDDAHVATRALPSLTRTVDVPASVHAHVRAEDKIAGEMNEKVFADGTDAFDRAAGERRVFVDAVESRQHGLEGRDLGTGQRAMQRARGPKDGVSLRHPSTPSGRSGQVLRVPPVTQDRSFDSLRSLRTGPSTPLRSLRTGPSTPYGRSGQVCRLALAG